MYYGIKKINEKYKINIPVERLREYTPVEMNANQLVDPVEFIPTTL